MSPRIDVLCFSHLRWRAQQLRAHQLLRRCAAEHRVFFVEEPIYDDGTVRMELGDGGGNVVVVTPYLPVGLSDKKELASLKRLIDVLVVDHDIREHVLWLTTPNAAPHTRHLRPLVTVYDVMDDLHGPRGAPEVLREREQELLQRATFVLADGEQLAEPRRRHHARVVVLPSGVDVAAYQRGGSEPEELKDIPRPRLGVLCPLDERLDTELLCAMADARPQWHWVLVGPSTWQSRGRIPRRDNVHHVGLRPLEETPGLLAALDVVTMPLLPQLPARPLSAARVLECLAADRPVVATVVAPEVQSVVGAELVQVAGEGSGFLAHVEAALAGQVPRNAERRAEHLAHTSWDDTWARARTLLQDAITASLRVTLPPLMPSLSPPTPLPVQQPVAPASHDAQLTAGAGSG
ncbi:MAG: glycosyltransferase [Myxococcota bacterium]